MLAPSLGTQLGLEGRAEAESARGVSGGGDGETGTCWFSPETDGWVWLTVSSPLSPCCTSTEQVVCWGQSGMGGTEVKCSAESAVG